MLCLAILAPNCNAGAATAPAAPPIAVEVNCCSAPPSPAPKPPIAPVFKPCIAAFGKDNGNVSPLLAIKGIAPPTTCSPIDLSGFSDALCSSARRSKPTPASLGEISP